jgi:hypothetical protein
MNNNEDIRLPDKVVNEKLSEKPINNYEEQIEEATHWSILEFNQQKELNEKYEREIHENHIKEISIRKEKFKDLLNDLKKIIYFDDEIRNIYEIIEPVIESYIAQYIEFVQFDKETYDKIFTVLGKIRTNKQNIERLKNIIQL